MRTAPITNEIKQNKNILVKSMMFAFFSLDLELVDNE